MVRGGDDDDDEEEEEEEDEVEVEKVEAFIHTILHLVWQNLENFPICADPSGSFFASSWRTCLPVV